MKVDQKINSMLMSFPFIKKIVKRFYQVINVILKKPKKYEGNIECVSPQDNFDYFFGYYDKSPWDISNRYMLCMKTKDTSKNVAPNEKLEILLIDTENNNKVEKIAESHAWNVQQGCMAQWLGPDYNQNIIYNDFRNNKYCSVILNIKTKKERVIDFPIYSVSSDGKFAFSLDFSRLHRLRPGYGYSNLEDTTKNEKIPNSTCIWKIDLKENEIIPFLKYNDFYNFEQRSEMIGAVHKVNHIMISPNNDKFMVIHRWIKGNKKYSRLVTCNIKSKKLFNLSDDNMVSHCYWKNNNEIIGFLNKKNDGNGYYLLTDNDTKYSKIKDDITNDGHPSYSFSGKYILTDSYPNKNRIQTIRIFSENEIFNIVKVFSPFKYDNDTRCDLHPRWSRDNKFICFDGCFDGRRRLYSINVSNIVKEVGQNKIIKNSNTKKKILFFMTSCKKCGPTNQTLNIIKNLDREQFDPYLLTIYEEEADSQINRFIPYIEKHYTIITSKKSILLKKTKKLDDFLKEFNADVIHTVGLFPNYYQSNNNKYPQITTLRNYIYDDYPAKFGKVLGYIMAKLQLSAMKKTNKIVTCSKSLKDIYNSKLHMNFGFVQNGVDVTNYKIINKTDKEKLKNKLKLNYYDTIFIYTGQFIPRKNIEFLLKNYVEIYKDNNSYCLLLLGDGPLLSKFKNEYEKYNNIIFLGNVNNVNEYLSISDYYISTSKSEGLPNGALEALSCGIPVILSDIEQHKELFMYNDQIGLLFKNDDNISFKAALNNILALNYDLLRLNSRKNIDDNFSDKIMSKNYQKIYLDLIKKNN